MSYEIKARAGNGILFVEFEGLDGKRKRVSLGTRDESVAKVKARAEYLKAMNPEAPAKDQPKVKTAAFSLRDAFERMKREDWAADQVRSKATIWSDIECICRTEVGDPKRPFGDYDVREIDYDLLQEYVSICRTEGIGYGTIDKRLSRFSRTLRKCATAWKNPSNGKFWLSAMPLIPRVKVPERRDQVVTFEQEAKLYEGCDHFAKDTGQRVVWWLFRHFVMWALDLGFRKGELLAFKLSDLTFARNDETGEEGWVAPVKANGTKTGQAKAVPLTARVWESVETFKRMGLPEDEPIFGSTLTVGKVQEMWTKLCEYAGMADYHIHDLRHTAATRWRKRGIPLDLIARMLGHASPEITYKVYQHLDPSDLVDAVRKSEKSRPQLRVVGE